MPANENSGAVEAGVEVPSRAKAESLLAQIASLSNKYLPPLVRTMFDHADTTLFEMAEEAGTTNPQESPYLKTMRELRSSRVEIETAFYQETARSFEFALLPSDGKATDTKEESSKDEFDFDIDSLSLVEDENLEESLTVRKMADRLRGQQQNLFSAIDKRLEHLLLHHNGHSHDFPATPEAICGAINKAVAAVEMDTEIKLIILKLFEIHVINEMMPFFEELNHLLEGNEILPGIQTNRPWRNQVVRSSGPATSGRASGGGEAPAGGDVVSDMPMGSGQGGGMASGGGDVVSDMPMGSGQGGGMASGGGGVAAGGSPNIPPQTAAATGTNAAAPPGVTAATPSAPIAGDPAEVDTALLASLNNLLNVPESSTVVPIQPGVQATAEQPIIAAQPTQLLSGLTGLQHQQAIVSGGAKAIDSASLKTMLAGNLQASSGDESTFGFQQRESMLIDVIAMLFEFILEDSTIPVQAKDQISRLQIPMVKAALIDESFLAKKANPARQLLNRLAQASALLDRKADQQSPLLQALIHVVDTITDQFENDMSIFEQQLDYLTNFLSEEESTEEKVNERIIDAKAKREEEARKRLQIQDAVDLRLSTIDAPAPIRDLINSSWRKVLVHTGVTHGMESEIWQHRNEFIERLINSLKPSDDADTQRGLIKVIPGIVTTLRTGMHDAGFSNEAIQQVLKVIEPMHMAIISHSSAGDAIAAKARKHHAMEKALDAMESEMRNLDDMLEQLDGSLLDKDYVSEQTIPGDLLEDSIFAADSAMNADNMPEDKYLEAIRNLQIGQTVVLQDKDGNPVRGKLSWKSDLLGEYVFTNWRHKVVAETNLPALAIELSQGKLEILDENSILDRALGKVMGGLNKPAEVTTL